MLALKRAGVQLRTWADGYGYALVATGRVDAMTDMEAESYDIAPMPVILSEAGGRFTDLGGVPRFDGGSASRATAVCTGSCWRCWRGRDRLFQSALLASCLPLSQPAGSCGYGRSGDLAVRAGRDIGS